MDTDGPPSVVGEQSSSHKKKKKNKKNSTKKCLTRRHLNVMSLEDRQSCSITILIAAEISGVLDYI